jgi:hypothetical protein
MYVRAICWRLARRVVLDMVIERLEPAEESMDSRWALKARDIGWVCGLKVGVEVEFEACVLGGWGFGRGFERG